MRTVISKGGSAMRLCRMGPETAPKAAFYFDNHVVPVATAVVAHSQASNQSTTIPLRDDLLPLLHDSNLRRVARWLADQPTPEGAIPLAQAELLVPIPRPNKIFLLAGNYADHVRERGGMAVERAETYPYVFMKPCTALNHPSRPVVLPKIAPDAVDWELELAVVIGKRCRAVPEAEALNYVAGYTIINDITQRKFRPNPERKKREKDTFFDWLHGKWFDTFCPCGPCITPVDAIADPQNLSMELRVNGEVKQAGNSGQMVFPVAAIIEFISNMVTLEPGDLISTGTPAGVGAAKGTFLQTGDVIEGRIGQIGTLRTSVIAESV